MIQMRMILAMFVLFASLQSASAEKLSLNQISRYLNGLKSVSGTFTQINDDGTISTGKIFIKRPGRVRFEYNPPNKALVMAGGGQLAIFDDKSNQPPEEYPLAKTPLNLILKRNVDLARANMVVAHQYDGTATSVTAQDPEHPDYGNIRLVFSGPPVELRQWIITGSDGTRTTVVLGALDKVTELPPILFSIPIEVQKRGR